MSDTHSLITILSGLPDPRVERSKEHELTDLLAIALCTLLVGGESFYDMADFGHARKDWLQTCREDFKGGQKCASKGGQIYWARIWRRSAGRSPALGSWARMLMVPLGWRQ